jgi:NAD(P)-dependent dehydrogenase (short-subunit alcohol dehydrogenase family)
MTVALVTGSAGAIGSEIVRVLASRGMTVVAADVHEPSLDDLAARGPGEVVTAAFDVADVEAVEQAVAGIVARTGRVDVLVNAAGIFGDMTRTDRIDPDVWDRYVQVDLSGPFYVARAVLPGMVERRWGRIVNVSSISSTEGGYRQAHYTAAKAGLIGLTRSLALEFATAGITCNAVMPGPIATDKLDRVPPDVLDSALAAIPAHRMGTPADIAHAVAYLASEEAAYVNGIALPVDAGAMLLQFKFARETRYDDAARA